MNDNEKTIDIVITWVDGNNSDFIRRKNEYLKDRDTDIEMSATEIRVRLNIFYGESKTTRPGSERFIW